MTDLVQSARKYLGVKFRHQGRTPRGLDCAGLVWLAYKDLGVTLSDYRRYGPQPFNDGLVTKITEALGSPVWVGPVKENQLRVGDVIVVRFEVEPHHVAIVAPYRYGGFAMLHADGHTERVLEHRLTPQQIAKITHIFRRPV